MYFPSWSSFERRVKWKGSFVAWLALLVFWYHLRAHCSGEAQALENPTLTKMWDFAAPGKTCLYILCCTFLEKKNPLLQRS